MTLKGSMLGIWTFWTTVLTTLGRQFRVQSELPFPNLWPVWTMLKLSQERGTSTTNLETKGWDLRVYRCLAFAHKLEIDIYMFSNLSCSLENWTQILGRLQNTHSDKGTVLSDQIAVHFRKLHQRLGNSPRVGSYLPNLHVLPPVFVDALSRSLIVENPISHHGVAWQKKTLRFYRMYADGSIGYRQEYVASQI